MINYMFAACGCVVVINPYGVILAGATGASPSELDHIPRVRYVSDPERTKDWGFRVALTQARLLYPEFAPYLPLNQAVKYQPQMTG